MARKYWYVVVHAKQWGVKVEGAPSVTSFGTQEAAIQEAARQAKAWHTMTGHDTGVKIQAKDGKFRDERSYGNDPNPPRG